jgi:hypothetical protein
VRKKPRKLLRKVSKEVLKKEAQRNVPRKALRGAWRKHRTRLTRMNPNAKQEITL